MSRPRPQLHFTADDGWINDAYGIGWRDGRYHLYYQAVPGQVVWGPGCCWGHAESPDLVHWAERPLALTPQEFELGCWSGSVVHTNDPPVLFYTRVTGPDPEIGQVATASLDPGTETWRTRVTDVAVDRPPDELGALCFRDPFVFQVADGWRMLVGAALPGGAAAAVQYRSTDLHSWSYDGVLCTRLSSRDDEVWTGSLWECPQLLELDRGWVLIVSVWDDRRLHHVAAAVGDYDGGTFTPRRWQRLTHGSSAYATTAFQDRHGRRCVLSWLREEPADDPRLTRRAGALSVVSTLEADAEDRLEMRPHPDVLALRQPAMTDPSDGRYVVGAGPFEVALDPGSPGSWAVQEPAGDRLVVTVEPSSRTLVLDRPGFGRRRLPLSPHGDRVTVLVDADIVEVFGRGGYGAYRIAPAADPSATTLTGSGAAAPVVRLFAP